MLASFEMIEIRFYQKLRLVEGGTRNVGQYRLFDIEQIRA
jgi:DNA-binding transcriptional MerR regulator